MISINATLLAQGAHFLVLYYILKRLMIEPIWGTIRERQEYLQKVQRDLGELEQKAKSLAEQYQEAEAQALKRASKVRYVLKEEGIQLAQEQYNEAQAQVTMMRSNIHRAIDEQMAKIRPELKDEAIKLVDEIIPIMIGRRL